MNGYFYFDTRLEYPEFSPYMPKECYPEYPYNDFPKAERDKKGNEIYEAVRNLFVLLQLDSQNQGKKSWNPLGEYIKPGQTVLLKPNLVSHYNQAETDMVRGMECLVTHPSVVRCIFDYVYIALKGKGKIIVADAPIQGCDFEKLLQNTGYGKLISYLQKKATESLVVQAADLREVTYVKTAGGIVQKERKETSFGSKTVDLKTDSFFEGIKNKTGFRVTSYAGKDTRIHHDHGHNEYKISDALLEADVVINIPKPKTHRIAGYTGALKNMIGINARKECLPHHQKGAKGKGGDEYLDSHGVLKWMNSTGNDVRNYAVKKNHQTLARLANEFCRKIGRKLDKCEPNRKKFGMWHGNDTIWRTILDMNRIVHYADKNGIMQKQKQRKILHVGDMVVCGEGEGPLAPSYKKVGGILFSEDAVLFDFFVVKLMGFQWEKFPVLVNADKDEVLLHMWSNDQRFDKDIMQIRDEDTFRFAPTKGWSEHLSQI